MKPWALDQIRDGFWDKTSILWLEWENCTCQFTERVWSYSPHYDFGEYVYRCIRCGHDHR